MTRMMSMVFLLLLGPAARSNAQEAAPIDRGVIAEVGAARILVSDLREALVDQRQRDLAQDRLDSFGAAGRAKVLDELIDVKLFSLAARENRLHERPDTARRLQNLIDAFLAQAYAVEVASVPPLTETVVRQYFDAHPDEFRGPTQVRARHAVGATRPEAEEIRSRLAAGEDFAAVAKDRNIDGTKATGGDLGWIRRGVMVEPFEKVLFSLKALELSPVVQTSFGFHVIQVLEIRKGELPDLETVKEAARQRIVDRRVADARERLRAAHAVRVDQDLLARLDR